MTLDINIKNKSNKKKFKISIFFLIIIFIVFFSVFFLNPGDKIIEKQEIKNNYDLCNNSFGIIPKKYICDNKGDCIKTYINCSFVILKKLGDNINGK